MRKGQGARRPNESGIESKGTLEKAAHSQPSADPVLQFAQELGRLLGKHLAETAKAQGIANAASETKKKSV
jgi:hypothetical protein